MQPAAFQVAGNPPQVKSQTWVRWRRAFLQRPSRVIAVVIVLATIGMGIFAPVVAPHDPQTQRISARLSSPGSTIQGEHYVLGTDQLGRDVLSRLIYGTRVSLLVGIGSVAFAAMLGVSLGLIAGFVRGKTGFMIMGIGDIQMAFPFILLALSVVAVLGQSLRNLVIVFGITSWVVYARTIRSVTLTLREQEFVTAARVLGVSNRRILIRHILPNVINPIVVIASFEIARIISTEAALSFLGLGVPPTVPTWGSMISDGRAYLQTAWWIATFPGIALALLVVAINLLGDALRDALDPRHKSF